MAKGSNLVLQGITGSLAGIILTKAADGETVIRSKPGKVRQPDTDAQLTQRGKFGVITKIAAKNKLVIRNYTKKHKPTASAYNAFVRNNSDKVANPSPNTYVTDYKGLQTVTGGGAEPYNITPAFTAATAPQTGFNITATWTYDRNNPTHNLNDQIGFVIIETSKDLIRVEVATVAITAQKANINVQVDPNGDTFVIPFFLNSNNGYGSEITDAVLIPSTGTPSIVNRF